ncbi:MAG: DNA ligase [Planctomycetes bacterium]|nr:DNA ligase [Planctomycetota bacterium]
MSEPEALPDFVEPMLAKAGPAFDSDDHVFEIKWDGMRTLAFVERGEVRLVNRRRNVVTARYPDILGLARLPDGCVLDGEIVVHHDGKPAFERLLQREQVRDERRIRTLMSTHPATYMAFDVLYEGFAARMDQPLRERRDILQGLIGDLGDPRIFFSDGVIGAGVEFFGQACAQELEGVVAKRLESRYRPGRRTDAWTKVKRAQTVYCAILGWHPDDKDPADFRSLVIATDVDGELTFCGRVGSGIGHELRATLNRVLRERHSPDPIVAADGPAEWIDPVLFCTVTFLEKTEAGHLRAPRLDEVMWES